MTRRISMFAHTYRRSRHSVAIGAHQPFHGLSGSLSIRSDNDVGSPGRADTGAIPRAGLLVTTPQSGEPTQLRDVLLSALLSVVTFGVLYVVVLVLEP